MKAAKFIPETHIDTIAYDEDIHHDIACQWWEEWKWIPSPKSFIPKETGVVATYNGNPTCMGWIYTTNSAYCLMEMLVSDKNQPKDIREESVEATLDGLITLAMDLGFEAITCMFQSRKLIERLKKRGFDSDEVTNLVVRIV